MGACTSHDTVCGCQARDEEGAIEADAECRSISLRGTLRTQARVNTLSAKEEAAEASRLSQLRASIGDAFEETLPMVELQIEIHKQHQETLMWMSVAERLELLDEIRSNESSCGEDEDEQIWDEEGIDHIIDGEGMDLDSSELNAACLLLKRRQLPARAIAQKLLVNLAKYYERRPTLVNISRPEQSSRLVIVGDLHGHFGDLRHILEAYGDPKAGPGGTVYLFNGDFVDRGIWGPEVLLLLYCMKLMSPDAVHLNRGNHESKCMNRHASNGFMDHCERAWPGTSRQMYKLCYHSFKRLPLCHVVGEEIFVVHGGLPMDPNVTLDEINRINRIREVPTKDVILCGYAEEQCIESKRDLLDKNLQKHVAPGTRGVLLKKVQNIKDTDSPQVTARFGDALIDVRISGTPSLEEDVEIVYQSDKERLKQRQSRLFTSLLWSDPSQHSNPSNRGAGCFFDPTVSKNFLLANKLRCVLRSHEKKKDGFSPEHYSDSGEVIVATVFSASNYPAGAGEPGGNRAAVIVLNAVANGEPLAGNLQSQYSWHESYRKMDQWTGRATANPMLAKIQKMQRNGMVEAEAGNVDRCLEQLWLEIFCRRGVLLSYFNDVDVCAAGYISRSEWATAMQACIFSDASFPWESLAKYLADFDEHGRCRYAAFLERYENVLSVRLAKQWYGRALLSMFKGISLAEVMADWDRFDVEKRGHLSFQELRPLLRSRDAALSAEAEHELLFSVLSSLDADNTGFVRRSELEHALQDRDAWASSHAADDSQVRAAMACWSAVQRLLSLFSRTRLRIARAFHLFDEDDSGMLSRSEFKKAICDLLRGTKLLDTLPEWEPLLWRLVDTGRSGFVSAEEFILAFAVEDRANKNVHKNMLSLTSGSHTTLKKQLTNN